MPEILTHDTWTIARAFEDVLTLDDGSGSSALVTALAALNTALDDAGYTYALPLTPTVEVCFKLGQVDPSECPLVRIPVDQWGTSSEPSGMGNQGIAAHTMQVVSYLTDPNESNTKASERTLAHLSLLWDKAIVHAVRRRDGKGVRGYASASIMQINRIRVDFGSYAMFDNHDTKAAKITQTWRIMQDARY